MKNPITIAKKIAYTTALAFTAVAAFSSTAIANTGSVVGNLSGEFAVNAGRLSYSLPIVAPEGIHGLKPGISINYSDSAGAGLLGVGFSLSASSSISRCTPSVAIDGFKSGLERNANARFCLDGQQLILVSGQQGAANSEYRSQNDENIRYFARGGSNYTPQYWEVESPDGFKYRYDKKDTHNTLQSAWFLTQKRDFFNNQINYHYTSGLMPLLSHIDYSGYRFTFNYENKEQSLGQYREGHYYQLSKRLASIVLSRLGTEINRYRFSYESIVANNNDGTLDPLERLKRLTQVEKCYGPNGGSGCLRPLTFEYQEQPQAGLGLDHPDNRTIVIPRSHYAASDTVVGTQLYYRPSFTSADMNQDGRPDFCYYKVGSGVMCATSNASGGYSAPVAWAGNLGYSATEDDYPYYSNLRLIDLNADTYPDFCLVDGSGVRCGTNNKGQGFTDIKYRATAFNHDSGFTFAYVNSDIYPDACGLTSNNQYKCYAGTASGVFSGLIVTVPDVDIQLRFAGGTEDHELDMPAAQWLDIDGDADNDLCWLGSKASALKCSYRSTNPSNPASSQSIVMSAPKIVRGLNYSIYTGTLHTPNSDDLIEATRKNVRRFVSAFRLSDVNGDLLPDICYASGHQYQCSINKGNGFASATTWINFSSLFSHLEEDGDLSTLVTIRLNDMNLDGLADFCLVYNEQQHCGYNQLTHFDNLAVRQSIAADVDTNVDTRGVYENFVRRVVGWKTKYVVGTSNLAYGNIINVPDINGDTYPEFCYRSIHGILCTSNDNYGRPAMLKGITDSFGQTTEVSYAGLITGGLYEPATSIPTGYYETPSNSLVVDTVKVTTGVSINNWDVDEFITNTQSYKYRGFLTNPKTGAAGFSAMSVTQNERGTKTTVHTSVKEYLVGRQTLIEEFIGNTLLKTKRNDYSVVNIGGGRHRVRLDVAQEKQFDLDGSLVSTSTATSANFDGYGYPRQATSVKTMAADGETLTTITNTQYLHDTQNWLLAKPDLQTVRHQYQGKEITRVVDYHINNGLMTGETIQPGAANASTIAYTYDAAGNTTTVTTSGGGQSRTVTKAFDSLGRVTSLTNSLGQSEHFAYHASCPGVTRHTDVAGKVTTTSYDFACRQLQVDAPDNNSTSWTYEWASESDNDPINQPIDHPYSYRNPLVYKVTETHANGTWSRTSFDALGRDVRTEAVGFSSERYQRAVVSDTVYDRFGRKTATTLPYHSVNGDLVTPSWITVDYDAASRITKEEKTGPNGSPLISYYRYFKNTTTQSYADYSKTTRTGVFGKPVSVNENGLTITYTYDALGNLLTTDQAGVITRVTYDDRGYKASQTDPAMGTWTYQYNAFGELVSQTDAKGQTTSFVYDELGRLIERTEPQGQTQWVYNTSGNGIGQLHSEQGVSASKQWAYDSLGRTVSETLTVDGQQFVTQFAYDEFSRLEQTTNPNGLDVFNEYDTTGAVSSVSIPANQVQGFDAARIKEEYEAVLALTLELESEILRLEEQRLHHEARYQDYKAKADYYEALLDEIDGELGEIARLRRLAQAHAGIAARYQQAIEDIRAKVNQYKSLYGDRVFTYKGIKNGRHVFQAIWCADRYRIWGGCKRREVRTVTLSTSNFNTIIGGDPVYATFTIPSYTRVESYVIGTFTNDNGEQYTEHGYRYVTVPAREVSQPTCDTYQRWEEDNEIGSVLVSVQQCAVTRPHQVYASLVSQFEQLRDNELLQAQQYASYADTPGNSDLEASVLEYVPTGNMLMSWVPIGIDIVTMIPVYTEETRAQWKRLSLNETRAYYQQQIDHYRELAEQSLAAYNALSRAWEQVTNSLDGLSDTEEHFARILQAAGILKALDDDYDIDLIYAAANVQEALANSTEPLMVWAATMRAPNGQVETELFGNGLYTQRTIDRNTGVVTSIETGAYSADAPLRKIDYSFNARGLIASKADTSSANNTLEDYTYDQQGRLTSWTFDQYISEDNGGTHDNLLYRTYQYDNRGNMTYKTGAGLAMHYNQANQLTSRDIVAGATVNYSYDANGNMLNGDGRTYQWNSFNKVSRATNSEYTVDFNYDAGQRRVMKKSQRETIYYVNAGYEKVIKHKPEGDEVIHRHHIWNGHEVVATFEKRDELTDDGFRQGDDVKYYHRDHLGNGELVTGADMGILSQRFFTPFGELVEEVLQREQNSTTKALLSMNINTDDYTQEILASNDALSADDYYLNDALFTSPDYDRDFRGFTSHEEIKELGLVNMNARLYDPVIGRFISADSVIPDLGQPMDYNRYSYVRNNPVLYSDPSGHNPLVIAALAFFVAAHLTDDRALQQFSAVVLALTLGDSGAMTGQQGLLYFGEGVVAAAQTAFAVTTTVSYLQTGDIKASVRAGAWSALGAGISHEIGDAFGKNGVFEGGHWTGKAALHGLAQGIIGSLRDGDFAAGFASGLAASVSGHFTRSEGLKDNPGARTAISMVSGYISAEATGGDGVQGALNAAIVFLYNDLRHEGDKNLHSEEKALSKVSPEDFDNELVSKTLKKFYPKRKDIPGADDINKHHKILAAALVNAATPAQLRERGLIHDVISGISMALGLAAPLRWTIYGAPVSPEAPALSDRINDDFFSRGIINITALSRASQLKAANLGSQL